MVQSVVRTLASTFSDEWTVFQSVVRTLECAFLYTGRLFKIKNSFEGSESFRKVVCKNWHIIEFCTQKYSINAIAIHSIHPVIC